MFTGLIEELGVITAVKPRPEAVELNVRCRETLRGASNGDSIAVDGICLTVTSHDAETFTALASAETLRKTNLVLKAVGDYVNLERSMTLEKRLGGHLVQGHVDCTATVVSIRPEGESSIWKFRVPSDTMKFFVPKGSVAVDGISLTVVDVASESFTVCIIPKTLAATTFQFRKAGDLVNIETDIIGKYVYRYMHPDETSAAQKTILPAIEVFTMPGQA